MSPAEQNISECKAGALLLDNQHLLLQQHVRAEILAELHHSRNLQDDATESTSELYLPVEHVARAIRMAGSVSLLSTARKVEMFADDICSKSCPPARHPLSLDVNKSPLCSRGMHFPTFSPFCSGLPLGNSESACPATLLYLASKA